MKITVVGAGNIGTQFAVHCAAKGHRTVLFTSRPELIHRHIDIINDEGVCTLKGELALATNNPEEAFANADCIFITYPANMMKSIARTVHQYAKKNALIGVVPGNGGSECAFRACIEDGMTFFGIERVPAIARLVEKGRAVRSTGYRQELHVASIPASEVDKCCSLVNGIFDIPCSPIPQFLNLTMTPSNPILHTARLKSMFRDYHEGVVYKHIPLFYEEWDDDSSRLLIECDEEVQEICRALPDFDLRFVKSLRVHYESPTIEMMTQKISSIPAFKGIKTPAVAVEGGWIPDFHSRYFTADFSYGLTVIHQIARFAGVKTPKIDEVMQWYKSIAIEKDEFRFEDYGIHGLSDLKMFYLR